MTTRLERICIAVIVAMLALGPTMFVFENVRVAFVRLLLGFV